MYYNICHIYMTLLLILCTLDVIHKSATYLSLNGHVATAVVLQDYERAKDLKRSLDTVARLRKKVMNMDQELMAVIRSYSRPRPIVQDTMRAMFLLLGNSLQKTKVMTIAIKISTILQY